MAKISIKPLNIALVFPGQGAHAPDMLKSCSLENFQGPRWAQLCELLGCDPRLNEDPSYFARNEVASLLTVFLSLCALQQKKELWAHCRHFAGYSVGQVSALFAAGLLVEEQVLEVVAARARAMNRCLENAPESGMLACIGLNVQTVREAIIQLGLSQTSISNINAPGQLSIAGDLRELEALHQVLSTLKPRKLVRIPTEGAWHSPWLSGAQAEVENIFLKAFNKMPTRPTNQFKVACNVTGRWLNIANPQEMAHILGRQVAEPVQWEACVRTCIADGAREFIEMGYGTVLTRFGFFIDRSCIHRHWET